MNINVTVEEVTLATLVQEVSEYREHGVTVADVVADKLVKRITSDGDTWRPFRDAVTAIRDEEIRNAVVPLIAEALAGPLQQTNSYGEPAGGTTTLREIVIGEARKALNATTGDRYSGTHQPLVRKIVAEEVKNAFASVIADEVKKAREMVAGEIGATVAAAVAEGMRKR